MIAADVLRTLGFIPSCDSVETALSLCVQSCPVRYIIPLQISYMGLSLLLREIFPTCLSGVYHIIAYYIQNMCFIEFRILVSISLSLLK